MFNFNCIIFELHEQKYPIREIFKLLNRNVLLFIHHLKLFIVSEKSLL